jgi:dipeptidyl aminopeptidase/acylaminoacyl peptidase
MVTIARKVPLIPREILFGNPERTGPSISPDGTRMAHLAPLDGVLNLWVGRDGEFHPITHERGRPIGAYYWAQDDRHLLYTQDVDGDENHHLYATDLESGEIRDLTPFPEVQAAVVAIEPRVPGTVMVALNRERREWHDLYRLELTTGTLDKVATNPGFGSWLVDSRLRVRGGTRSHPDGGWELQVRGSQESPWRTLLTVDPDDALGSSVLGFGGDDRHLFLLSAREADTSGLIRVDTITGEVEQLARDARYDLGEVMLHPQSRDLQAVAVVRDRRDFLFFDEAVRQDVERVRALHPGNVSIVSRDRADRVWIIATDADQHPPAYHVLDRRSGELSLLFEAQPALNAYPRATMETFEFEARDGKQIQGYLTFPVTAQRSQLPTVLVVHGGPWARDTWGFNGHDQWLANRGYLAARVNFRGSTGYGKAFVNAGDHEWAGRMHDDLVDAVKELTDRGYADTTRVAIYGGSYGGYAALVGATFTPDLFCCAVGTAAPVNLKTLLESMPTYWAASVQPMLYRRMGHPEQDADELWSRSPLSRVDQIRVPILLAYGANDPRVKRSEAEQIVAAMETRGIDYKYLLFEDEGHYPARPENRLRLLAEIESFLARHLGGRSQDDAAEEAADA